jgi:spermidine/putrescine-binding protein
VLPAEGTILWNEHLVIPAASPRQRTAEAFINFMLQPENGALFVNAAYYPIPVEGLTAFLDPAVRDNPFIYPPLAELTQAELSLPLSPAGQQLYDTWWAQWQAYQP